ncbi:MAG: DUF72 domain-containing protein [Acidimicrobiia bacterium]
MERGRLLVGTSGFAYKEWVGPFYPPGTKAAGMLPYYAGTLPSVEINYTFRRAPTPSMVEGWVKATPEDFAIACKAPQGITHFARLAGFAGERLANFIEAVTPLGGRLGPVLFQCPPNLRYDPAVLDAFLADLAARPQRFAMEFRHESFDTDEVRARLADAGVAWCVSDTEEAAGRFVRTAPDFAYLRLRRPGYDAAALAGWAKAIRPALEAGADVYCYLKHEEAGGGALDAVALRSLLG